MRGSLFARIGRSARPMVVGLVLIAAVWLLPDLSPTDDLPIVRQRSDHARIIEDRGVSSVGTPVFLVELDSGERIEAEVQDASGALPGSPTRAPYAIGDEVVVVQFTGPAAAPFAAISEPWRVPVLGIGAALFAAAVIAVGGLRGARSLVALALTLAVVIKLVIPLLLRGFDPIPLAVGGGILVTVATLLLTEGPSRVTWSAVLGTAAALGLTAVLAAIFTAAAEFTALQGTEEIAFLIPIIGDRVDLQGILLAATVFGALGVLDDVTVTQAATVEQLHRARPEADRGAVIGRAMQVGRAHIAATVNTLMLAYLGVSLPLLLLFALSGESPLTIMNGEIVAVEVVRALVGSVGIVAAVPITTFAAAWLIVRHEPVRPSLG